MNTLTLNIEELEQRIAPDPIGTGGSGSPPGDRLTPPFFVLPTPVE